MYKKIKRKKKKRYTFLFCKPNVLVIDRELDIKGTFFSMNNEGLVKLVMKTKAVK